jgi:hypothetical protein
MSQVKCGEGYGRVILCFSLVLGLGIVVDLTGALAVEWDIDFVYAS